MKKITFIFISMVLALGFGACTDEVEYTPAEVPGNDQVYFPVNQVQISQIDLDNEGSTFNIQVSRLKTDNAATVNVTVTDPAGIFTIPSSVSFAAGESEATITIGYDPAQLGFENYFPINLVLDEAYATPYGVSDYTFQVGIPYTWQPVAVGDYLYSLYFSGNDEGLPLYRALEDPTQFMIDNWGAGIGFRFSYDETTGDAIVKDQSTGDTNANYGPVSVMELADYPEAPAGYSHYEDGVFNFSVIYYVSQGYFGYGVETYTITEGDPTGPVLQRAAYTASINKSGQKVEASLHALN